MGNCCSYVMKFDHPVSDPITVNEVGKVCETEKNGSVSPKKKTKKKEPPPKNGGLILALPPPDKEAEKKKPPSTDPTTNSPGDKEKTQALIAKTQTLMVEPTPNRYLQEGGSKTMELVPNQSSNSASGLKSSSLNPEDIIRKDVRALTAREEENNEKKKKESVVNVGALKITDEILKKIEKLNSTSSKQVKANEEGGNSPLRSQTLGNENNLFDDVQEGTSTKKEEIKKNLIETKDNLEKRAVLEKKPSKTMNKDDDKNTAINEKSKSLTKNEPEKTQVENSEVEAPMPRKSLLKRFKTIGDDGKREKSKKKVKFKDLFDARGKKKVKRVKK